MNKKEIVNKLKTDLGYAHKLISIMPKNDICERLEAQIGYINNLLEWIEHGGKV